MRDITTGDCLQLRHIEVSVLRKAPTSRTLFYTLLKDLGNFPPNAPATLRSVSTYAGQSSAEELVDRYHVQCRPVRVSDHEIPQVGWVPRHVNYVIVHTYKAFDRPGLWSVPAGRLHCTVLHAVGLGAADVNTDALIEDVADYARTRHPFVLTFDRPAVAAVAVEISGWPGRPFTEIVDAVTQAAIRTGVPFKPAPSRYPHVSVAYTADGAQDVDPVGLRAELADIEHPVSQTLIVDRLHLVEQWHDGAQLIWDPVAEIPLAGAAA
ncbi:2'-5' RNA ligase family protein [Streptomyces sp. NPDC101776]|uniref:2'-5' RNA ligase family protein n=1 Tax=Streptomyces sp. NPDC101776 TaxID=3366146 RepID=UPI003804A4A1